MDVVSVYLLFAFMVLSPVRHAAAAVPKNETVNYYFDTSSNAVAVKLGNKCYVSKISYHDASELHNPDKIQHFENTLLELIALHQQHHKLMTIRELLDMSGTIAHDCQTAIEIFRISDPYNVLGLSTGTPRDCYDVQKEGANKNGVYKINPSGTADLDVYCDIQTDGGGWLVFQKRFDGSLDFNEDWVTYKTGFGDVSGEFWLGNSILHSILNQTEYTLRIDMEDEKGTKKFAIYDKFSIGDESTKFKLSVSGYSGDAGDDLSLHNHMKFSTRDEDNDISVTRDCAVEFGDGWWFAQCYACNLNGAYRARAGNGIAWNGFSPSLKGVDMKIRPYSRT